MNESANSNTSRREFIKTTGRIAAVSALAGVTLPHVQAAARSVDMRQGDPGQGGDRSDASGGLDKFAATGVGISGFVHNRYIPDIEARKSIQEIGREIGHFRQPIA